MTAAPSGRCAVVTGAGQAVGQGIAAALAAVGLSQTEALHV
jgi:NAD(P)-dependent dehydrogenase (short-subunit alcohol dehydrogenase family)